MFNPIYEAARFDPRLKIKLLSTNFVEFKGANLTIAPVDEPLRVSVSASYMDFSWKLDISVDPDEKQFIDLTPVLVREAVYAQLSSLRELIGVLEPYGFDLRDLREKLDQISLSCELAILGFEDRKYDEAFRHLNRVQILCRDAYTSVVNIYINVIGWTPTLTVILVLFSFFLSRLVAEEDEKANMIFAFLLLITVAVFLITHQGFRFFILGFHQILQKINAMISLRAFILQVLQAASIVVIAAVFMFSKLRDLLSQSFGIGIKNLRRRKFRTLLALFTLILISAAAMCLLTFSPKITFWNQVYHLKPKVNSGIVVYKQNLMVMKLDSSVPVIVNYVALQPYEVSLFLWDWAESSNIYGIKNVRLSRDDGFSIDGFNSFSLVLVDPEFMEKHLHISEVLGSKWLSPSDQNMVLVGSQIALKYNLTENSTVLLDGRRFTVKAVFDEEKAAGNLKDLDGEYFLLNIYDAINKRIRGGSFIFGSIKDFPIREVEVYKVSLVLRSDLIRNASDIINNVISSEFDYWDTEAATIMVGYLVRVASNGIVLQAYPTIPTMTFLSGNWQDHIVPLLISSFILFTNALQTIFERKSEIRMMSTIGASPTRVRFILIIEGLVLGIIGGLCGYVLGYTIAYITASALPSSVQKNLISGSPFTITFFASVISSVIGYSLPLGEAIKVVVPSGMVNRKVSEMIKIGDKDASLEMPIRLSAGDMPEFEEFLKGILENYGGITYEGITMYGLSSHQSEDEKLWSFILKYYKDQPTTNFQVIIAAKINQELKVTIKPLSIIFKELNRWTDMHKSALIKITPKIREEILKFTLKKKAIK